MISEHELLENGSKQQRCQVVRWVRTFPFSFLSKREYCIGRRMWRSQDGCLYGITKVPFPCQIDAIMSNWHPGKSFCHLYDGDGMPGGLLCVLVCGVAAFVGRAHVQRERVQECWGFGKDWVCVVTEQGECDAEHRALTGAPCPRHRAHGCLLVHVAVPHHPLPARHRPPRLRDGAAAPRAVQDPGEPGALRRARWHDGLREEDGPRGEAICGGEEAARLSGEPLPLLI